MSDSVQPRRQQPTRLPPSLGFSRQEHWSGLPFPSPLSESEKWKWSCSVVSDSLRSHGLQPTRLLCPWDFPGKSTGVGYHCLFWEYSAKPSQIPAWGKRNNQSFWFSLHLKDLSFVHNFLHSFWFFKNITVLFLSFFIEFFWQCIKFCSSDKCLACLILFSALT